MDAAPMKTIKLWQWLSTRRPQVHWRRKVFLCLLILLFDGNRVDVYGDNLPVL